MAEKKQEMDTTSTFMEELSPLLPLAKKRVQEYLQTESPDKSMRDQARLAKGVLDTGAGLQRAVWSQQRARINTAKVLADGDLDALQAFVQTVDPGINIRKAPVPVLEKPAP